MVPEGEAQPDNPEQQVRSAEKPVRSLVDRNWKSVSKITLDLPWRPARAGRQEKREREKGRRGKQSDERGRREKSSETCHIDKPGL